MKNKSKSSSLFFSSNDLIKISFSIWLLRKLMTRLFGGKNLFISSFTFSNFGSSILFSSIKKNSFINLFLSSSSSSSSYSFNISSGKSQSLIAFSFSKYERIYPFESLSIIFFIWVIELFDGKFNLVQIFILFDFKLNFVLLFHSHYLF